MGVITLLTDFGKKDHYVAALKANIYSIAPNTAIFDISHEIEKYDITHAAFVLNGCISTFPSKSIHIVDVGAFGGDITRFLIVKCEDQLLILPDNGIISLIANQFKKEIYALPESTKSFASLEMVNSYLHQIINTEDLKSFAEECDNYKNLKKREIKITDNSLHGNIIHVDDYGNLITNISTDHFEATSDDRKCLIKFKFETIDGLVNNYNNVDAGDIAVFFNEMNLIEIGINNGNASALLGMKFDSPVTVQFKEKSLF